jgi:uncharacterized protein YndB with AHSA1/START domain
MRLEAPNEILIQRTVKAPRHLVWAAMTDPAQVTQWWGPTGFTTTIHAMDVRVDGIWSHTMHGPDGTDYPNKSKFREVLAPERLVFTQGGGKAPGRGASFLATWSFDEVPGGTLVTISMLFPSVEDRNFVAAEYGAVEGGAQTLARLDAYLQG